MTLFVWERISGVTTNYHPDAGVAIVAADRTDAQERIDSWRTRAFAPDIPPTLLLPSPDHEWTLDGHPEPRVLVFPDAGCC